MDWDRCIFCDIYDAVASRIKKSPEDSSAAEASATAEASAAEEPDALDNPTMIDDQSKTDDETKGTIMDDCLFCKLVSGEIPTNVVYEDDDFLAFDDIEPECPIHTLVIPKKHYESLQDNVPAELLGKLWKVVPEVAKIKGVYESGYRSVINTGPDSAATQPHLHVHILGGVKLGRFTFEGSQRLG